MRRLSTELPSSDKTMPVISATNAPVSEVTAPCPVILLTQATKQQTTSARMTKAGTARDVEHSIRLLEEIQRRFDKLISKAKDLQDSNMPADTEKCKLKIISSRIVRIKRKYTIPLAYRAEMRGQLQELLDKNIISPADIDAFCSPGFVIGRKNGKRRLVIDYREVNKITEEIGNIFPDGYTTLREIPTGMRVLSQIDLKNGYHQIAMEESSKRYTGFSVMGRHYVYNRMPFGLKNAPAFFQRIIFNMIGHLPFVTVFLDDTLVFSKDVQEHADHLAQVMNILHAKNVVLNLEKSNFYKTKVTYLGNMISEDGRQANIEKLPGLRSQPPPRNGTELMSLIGTINWYRNYIPNASEQIEALNDKLTGGRRENLKRRPITWTEKDEKTRQKTFDIIEGQIVLADPEPTLPFQLRTDASDRAIGAELTQKDMIIGFFSKKLTTAEKNYTTLKKKLSQY